MSRQIKADRPSPSANREVRWGSDLAAALLRGFGIKYVTHNPGSSFGGLHDSIVNGLGNESPTLLLCLSENAAVAIAHGYAKVTGEPIACLLHANVGVLNGAMAIFDAWTDRVPVYIVGGSGPADSAQRLPWIHWVHSARDQASHVRAYTKWDDEPRSVQAMVESMLRANLLARTVPMAPVYICLDAEVQNSEAPQPLEIPDLSRFAAPETPAPPCRSIARAAELLASAKRPVIMAGRVSRSREAWASRIRLAELLGAEVVSDLKTAAAFPTGHALHAGMGYHLRGPQREAVAAADVILSLDWIDLGGVLKSVYGTAGVKARVIQCSLASYVHNAVSQDYFGLSPVDVALQCDPDLAVRDLLSAVEHRLGGIPRRRTGTGQRARTAFRPPAAVGAPISVEDLAAALQAARAGHDITIARLPFGFPGDACSFEDPLDYLGYDGGAAVGLGPGHCVGAALALLDSQRKVIGVVGDSDFLQGANVMWTAGHYDIPLLLMVANNRSHLNDELVQERIAIQRGRNPENRWIGQRIDDPPVDIANIARGFGVAAEGPVRTAEELAPALQRGLERVAAGKPYVIDVAVLPDEATRLS